MAMPLFRVRVMGSNIRILSARTVCVGVVRVIGAAGDDDVREYRARDSGITWYVGHDNAEVAPSSVLANVLDIDGTPVFRAVVNTTSDVYYVEPASHHPDVFTHSNTIQYNIRLIKSWQNAT